MFVFLQSQLNVLCFTTHVTDEYDVVEYIQCRLMLTAKGVTHCDSGVILTVTVVSHSL